MEALRFEIVGAIKVLAQVKKKSIESITAAALEAINTLLDENKLQWSDVYQRPKDDPLCKRLNRTRTPFDPEAVNALNRAEEYMLANGIPFIPPEIGPNTTTPPHAQNCRPLDVSHRCPIDGRPCEVVELFAERFKTTLGSFQLEGSLQDHATAAIRQVVPHLPCSSCRKFEHDVNGLSGIQLGKTERKILLEAFQNPGGGYKYPKVWKSKAESAAHVRSVSALIQKRLLERHSLAFKLTTLGSVVLGLLGSRLQAKEKVRWRAWLSGVKRAGRKSGTANLNELNQTLERFTTANHAFALLKHCIWVIVLEQKTR